MKPRLRFEVTFTLGEQVFVIPTDSKRMFNRLFLHEKPFINWQGKRVVRSKEELITRLYRMQNEETVHSKRMERTGRKYFSSWQPGED